MRSIDRKYFLNGVNYLAGVDEAGRGPLAGPVVAAAVVFKENIRITGVKDSKQLSESERQKLFLQIVQKAESYSVGIVENNEIEEINILQATLLAMKKAVSSLIVKPDLILVDGNKTFNSTIETISIVKGDNKSFVIASASIIAKVTRDRIMKELSLLHPQYLWGKNKGYATKEHISAIKKFGITPFHRKTFLSKIINSNQQLSLNLL
ncbi:MAG: ribonuclease HII [Ignavibacteriaceae bacterium]|nr:ribonuclease HII [Ignavibacteriaceae bacterium]